MDRVDESPEKYGYPQYESGQNGKHDGDEEINEESDEGPTDEDDGGDDDDNHVAHQPGESQLGLLRTGTKVEHTGEDNMENGDNDEERVDQR